MTDRPRLLVVKGKGGIGIEQLCESLSSIADLVVVNVHSGKSPLEADHDRARAALDGRGALIPVSSYDAAGEVLDALDARTIDGVMTGSEFCLMMTAQIAEALGLKHISPEVVARVRDKYAQRAALRAAGVPCPAFARIAAPEDLDRAITAVPFPAVIKPDRGAGGFDTYQVNSEDELRRIYETSYATEKDLGIYGEPEFILEELLVGVRWMDDPRWGDYASVESFIRDGEVYNFCITDRTPLAKPFRETGVILPTSLPAERVDELHACATAAITALGIDYGATHTEMKFTADGPRIIEVNARLGGHLGYIFSEATDTDIVVELGRLALGEMPRTDFDYKRFSSWFFITPPQTDAPVRASGLDRIAGIPNVRTLTVSTAETFDWHQGEAGDAGMVTAVAATAKELLATRQAIMETVTFA
jgi:biotin carboxylase